MSRRRLSFGSLFTGIGGFDLGFERAGMRCAWQVEKDPWCTAVLARHWPFTPRYSDIRAVGKSNLTLVNVIVGGFPCQPFSSATRGRRRGTGDDRWLWPAMFRVVCALRPSWVVAENVTHLDGCGLEQVVSDLEVGGYEVATIEIPACAFGLDHRRSRLWILGHTDCHSEPRCTVDAETSWVPWGDRHANSVGTPHGVSGKLDRARLRGLGNAVVPAAAEFLGRLIVDVEATRVAA